MTLNDKMYEMATRYDDVLELTLTLDSGVAYADGDVLADTQELQNAVRLNGGRGTVRTILVLDKDDQAQGLDVVFMRTMKSLGTENSAVSISTTDAEEIIGVINIGSGDYSDFITNQIAFIDDAYVAFESDEDSKSLYVGAVSRGTGTYSAGGIVMKFGIMQY